MRVMGLSLQVTVGAGMRRQGSTPSATVVRKLTASRTDRCRGGGPGRDRPALTTAPASRRACRGDAGRARPAPSTRRRQSAPTAPIDRAASRRPRPGAAGPRIEDVAVRRAAATVRPSGAETDRAASRRVTSTGGSALRGPRRAGRRVAGRRADRDDGAGAAVQQAPLDAVLAQHAAARSSACPLPTPPRSSDDRRGAGSAPCARVRRAPASARRPPSERPCAAPTPAADSRRRPRRHVAEAPRSHEPRRRSMSNAPPERAVHHAALVEQLERVVVDADTGRRRGLAVDVRQQAAADRTGSAGARTPRSPRAPPRRRREPQGSSVAVEARARSASPSPCAPARAKRGSPSPDSALHLARAQRLRIERVRAGPPTSSASRGRRSP